MLLKLNTGLFVQLFRLCTEQPENVSFIESVVSTQLVNQPGVALFEGKIVWKVF